MPLALHIQQGLSVTYKNRAYGWVGLRHDALAPLAGLRGLASLVLHTHIKTAVAGLTEVGGFSWGDLSCVAVHPVPSKAWALALP